MNDDRGAAHARAQFRRTFVRVMLVQAVTLVLLWLLQAHFA
jgi:hypothetical protein